jgi:hypothetical protein
MINGEQVAVELALTEFEVDSKGFGKKMNFKITLNDKVQSAGGSQLFLQFKYQLLDTKGSFTTTYKNYNEMLSEPTIITLFKDQCEADTVGDYTNRKKIFRTTAIPAKKAQKTASLALRSSVLVAVFAFLSTTL